jgi:hypothetical protein
MGKEWFVNILKRRSIKEHGHQTAFYGIRDSDNKVVHLFENAHCFELEAFIGEYNLC